MDDEQVMRMLGVPGFTFDEKGTKYPLVTPGVYERVYGGEDVQMRYQSIRKTMENIPELVGYYQTRTIYAKTETYKEYN